MTPPQLRSTASLSSVRLSVERERSRSSLGQIQEDCEDGNAVTAARHALHRVSSPSSITASGHTSPRNASPTRSSFHSDGLPSHPLERRNKRQTMLSKVFTPSSPLDASPPLCSQNYFPTSSPPRQLEALLSNDLDTTVHGVQMLLLTSFHRPLDAKYNPQIARVLESYAKLKEDVAVLRAVNEKHTAAIIEANQRLRKAEEHKAEMKELYLEEIKRMEVEIASKHGLEHVTLIRTGTVLNKAQRSRPSKRQSQADLEAAAILTESGREGPEKHSVLVRSTWRNRARSDASLEHGTLPWIWAETKNDSTIDGLLTLPRLVTVLEADRSTDAVAVRRVAQILSNRTDLGTAQALEMIVGLLFGRLEGLRPRKDQGEATAYPQDTEKSPKIKISKRKKGAKVKGDKKDGKASMSTATGVLESLSAKISRSPKHSNDKQRQRASTAPTQVESEQTPKENMFDAITMPDIASSRTANRASNGYHSDPERPSSRPMSFMEGDDYSISGVSWKHRYLRDSTKNASRTSLIQLDSDTRPPLEHRRSKSASATSVHNDAPIEPFDLVTVKADHDRPTYVSHGVDHGKATIRRSTSGSSNNPARSIFEKPRAVRPTLRHMATESVITLTAFARSHGKSKDRTAAMKEQGKQACTITKAGSGDIVVPTVTPPSQGCQDMLQDIGMA